MYLEKRTSVKNWNHTKGTDEEFEVTVLKGGKEFTGIQKDKVSVIVEDVGYWRKANQIHNWFVQNVQNGQDDCKSHYVAYEQLLELKELCKKVLEKSKVVKGKVVNGQRSTENGWENIYEDGEIIEDPSAAMELLPTVAGFFFGSEGYDQWYVADLRHTIEVIEAIESCEGAEVADYYYQSSW